MSESLAPVVMVLGTGSSVGKSTLVAGLCRLLARRGVRVAPFKAQNMSNNAAVCAGGGEIGRAQYAQAIAAGVEPTVDMNPVLLKPQPDGSQVVVRGYPIGVQTASEYFRSRRDALWPVVAESLERLRTDYEVVVAEGAGSPAEINLRDRDLTNMRIALHAGADVLLVADIDRGGAFASLLGTWEWLHPTERALLRGFILNKFRGDATLLAPAPDLLFERTGVPVVGVVPYLADLALPEEDAASLHAESSISPLVDVAVIHLPHIANFDEFGPLAREPGVGVRYVTRAEELRAPDLVIVPGTKATIPDLAWLYARGLAERIRWLVAHDTPVLGVCGGYQMLGRRIADPLGLESSQRSMQGLGIFDAETVLAPQKRLSLSHGRVCHDLPGVWRALGGASVEGYEIHAGRTVRSSTAGFTERSSTTGDTERSSTGFTERPSPGYTERFSSAHTDRSSTGYTERPSTGRTDRSSSGCGDRSSTGYTERPSTGRTDRSSSGCGDRSSTGYTERPSTGDTDRSFIPLLELAAGSADGAVTPDGRAAGTYLHGMLEQPEPRHRLLTALAARRGLTWSPDARPSSNPYDLLADTLEASLQLDRIPVLSSRVRS
jgi:adenosylcobyric acid synthase